MRCRETLSICLFVPLGAGVAAAVSSRLPVAVTSLENTLCRRQGRESREERGREGEKGEYREESDSGMGGREGREERRRQEVF